MMKRNRKCFEMSIGSLRSWSIALIVMGIIIDLLAMHEFDNAYNIVNSGIPNVVDVGLFGNEYTPNKLHNHAMSLLLFSSFIQLIGIYFMVLGWNHERMG